MDKKLIGVFDAVKETWALFQKNIPLFLLLGVAPQVLLTLIGFNLVSTFGPDAAGVASQNIFDNIAFLFSGVVVLVILSLLVNAFLNLVRTILVIKIYEDKQVTVQQIFQESLNKAVNYSVLQIILTLVILVGYVLLIIPGIIFSIWFFAAMFLLIEDGVVGPDALRKSKELVSGYGVDIFLRFFGGMMLGIGVFIVISLVLSPLIGSSENYFYTDNQKGEPQLIPTLVQSVLDGLFAIGSLLYSYIIYRSLKKIKSGSSRESSPQTI